jgi:SRSO17 transposase
LWFYHYYDAFQKINILTFVKSYGRLQKEECNRLKERGKKVAIRYNKTPLGGKISDYSETVRLIKVDETKWENYWDEMVSEYHYLGFKQTMGARVKYIAMLGSRPVGAISFVSAMPRLKPRDEYVGCSGEERKSLLLSAVNNNRFLILPWVKIKNIASRILSLSIKRLKTDWLKQYECDPCLVETFVDTDLYRGTCYIASNWTYLGKTKGYGKVGKRFIHHGHKKGIFVLVINRDFAKRFKPCLKQHPQTKKWKVAQKMLESIPNWKADMFTKVGITAKFLANIPELLNEYLKPFFKCLKRPENEANMLAMLKGLMSDEERKSVEPIALAYMGASRVRSMQRFMSDSIWEEDKMLRICWSRLADLVSCENGMFTVDGTDFPKKGCDSAGVQRQYCGRLGKVDNCQASVMVGYAGDRGYGPIHRALYIPKLWLGEEYKSKRVRCGIPEDYTFKTKNQLAIDMINEIVGFQRFGAKWVGVDGSFGSDPNFLDSIPEGLHYFADVHSDQMVFTAKTDVYLPEYCGRGRKPARYVTDGSPVEVRAIANDNSIPWKSVVLADGAKGPVTANEKCLRVFEVRGKLPAKESWLYIRKDGDSHVRYSLCNAPADTDVATLRRLSVMRWSIEQCFEECKRDLGMDHNESRSWNGWNRHVLLVFIAHLFLNSIRLQFKDTLRDDTYALNGPVSFDEFSDCARDLLSNGIYSSIFVNRDAKFPFLTLPSARNLVSRAIPKIGNIMDILNYNQKAYSNSYKSAWHQKTKEIIAH